jgi:RND family efflux transporter MFP subunit
MSSEEQKPSVDLSALRINREKKFDDRPKSNTWKYIAWAIVLVLLVIGYFWLRDDIAPATKVQTATATLITGSDAGAALVATGYVVAQRKAEVASKGTGRLEFLGFEEGDQVKKGQIIASLDNADMSAQLEQAKANLRVAEADSMNTGRIWRRAQDLMKSGSITKTELENAETGYKMSVAAVASANAVVKAADVSLENTYIRAPFDGTILTKNADVGEIVAPFASSASSKGSVVTLADMKSLEVEADVSESNINKVRLGQPCEIILDAYPGVRYPGAVKKIVPTADRSRATVLTKISFTEIDDKVLPEMSARVNFFIDSTVHAQNNATPVVAVPKDAITTRDNQKIVFRIDGELVTAVPVQTGREFGSSTEILSGISQGDRVVLLPPGKMQSGQKIEISF